MAITDEQIRELMKLVLARQGPERFGKVNYFGDSIKDPLGAAQKRIVTDRAARLKSRTGPATGLEAIARLGKAALGNWEESMEREDLAKLTDFAAGWPPQTDPPPDVYDFNEDLGEVNLLEADEHANVLERHPEGDAPKAVIDDIEGRLIEEEYRQLPDVYSPPEDFFDIPAGDQGDAMTTALLGDSARQPPETWYDAIGALDLSTPAGELARQQAMLRRREEEDAAAQIAAALKAERAHELAVKKAGPGAKPGTPYEMNGYLVQDYIDSTGAWNTRVLGPAGEHRYSNRPGTAIQYTNRMTELRAQIAAIPDENSPERIVLQQELDDLLYNVARDPASLSEVSRLKALGTGRGTTAAEQEEDMRGIRDGILIKHDRLPLLQNTTNQIKELAEGFFTSGLTGSIAAINPGSDQYQMNKLIKNIHGATGLEELIAVKARGATFGALSDTEMELLIASIQALDPLLPADTLKDNLDSVMRLYEKGLNTSKQNFREVYGEDERRPWEPPPDSGVTQQEWDLMTSKQKRAFE
tara:strand:+ start:2190 stop:3773 length:1584 start_codon:yes stop_codon:yes gene_type:complete